MNEKAELADLEVVPSGVRDDTRLVSEKRFGQLISRNSVAHPNS